MGWAFFVFMGWAPCHILVLNTWLNSTAAHILLSFRCLYTISFSISFIFFIELLFFLTFGKEANFFFLVKKKKNQNLLFKIFYCLKLWNLICYNKFLFFLISISVHDFVDWSQSFVRSQIVNGHGFESFDPFYWFFQCMTSWIVSYSKLHLCVTY